MAKKPAKQQQVRLSQALVLNRYMLHLFGCKSLEGLSTNLKDAVLERYDENNVSLFYQDHKKQCYRLYTGLPLSPYRKKRAIIFVYQCFCL